MKWVKQSASTINRRREIELAMDRLAVAGESSSESHVMQGLYSATQTELFVPPPIIDVRLSLDHSCLYTALIRRYCRA